MKAYSDYPSWLRLLIEYIAASTVLCLVILCMDRVLTITGIFPITIPRGGVIVFFTLLATCVNYIHFIQCAQKIEYQNSSSLFQRLFCLLVTPLHVMFFFITIALMSI